MPSSKPLTLRVPKEIREAIDAFCKKTGESAAQLILRAVCNEIGQPDLVKTVRPQSRPKGSKKAKSDRVD